MKRKLLKTTLLSFLCFSTFGQTKEEALKITRNYDLNLLKSKIDFFQKKAREEKELAQKLAKKNNWPIYITAKDGTFQELMKITDDGYPVYYSTNNANAAKSTRANHLNSGGSLGLNLNGQNMVARVWDGGTVRRTHNLFTNRVTTVDDPSGTSYSNHATHVTGTIMASDASASTKGMAYQATARTFNWDDDASEAISETLQGMLISNHSYGVPVTSNTGSVMPAWSIGAYTEEARIWDEIAYNAKYYLPVMSAGNDGNNNDNTNPIASGYDKLTSNKTAKNILTIANAQDANVATNGDLISVSINSSSSQGPSDDRRIKPDITGNGTSLTSASSSGNTATTTMTGTSMSSPNVAGTLILLQQYSNQLTNNYMKAATLKGLSCHTADDAGNPGPDAKFGWGLLNAKKAAETLRDNGLNSWVSEEYLANNQTFTKTVSAVGAGTPLVVSITWTDVPGEAQTSVNHSPNDNTPVLVNDLDIRVTKNGNTYYPWRLANNPNSAATNNSDNNVDNVEVIKIDNPTAGDYQITVTHKNNLINNLQDFSLVITGITSSFALVSNSDDQIVCDTQNAVYTFNYKQTGNGTTNFSAVNLPNGATASFSPSSLNTNGTVTMTISGLSNVNPGNYYIGIKGDNGSETETRTKLLKVYSNNFQALTLNSPSNGSLVSTTVDLQWQSDINAEDYNVQVSTDQNFSSFFTNTTISETNYLITGLNQETIYYWRVIPSNRCGSASANNVTVNNFNTGKLTCGFNFTATDFSDANIADVANSNASVPIEVTGGIIIGDINVALNLSHTYIQDMIYYLEGPTSLGSPRITLFNHPCGDNDDINCTIDDSGVDFTCSPTAPAISGTVKPYETLSSLNGQNADGTWYLKVEDAYQGDGGAINAVTLSFCKLEQSQLSTPNSIFESLTIYPNPTSGILNINLNQEITGTTTYTLYDIQGRVVASKTNTEMSTLMNVSNLTEGVYLLTLENNNSKTTRKIIIKK